MRGIEEALRKHDSVLFHNRFPPTYRGTTSSLLVLGAGLQVTAAKRKEDQKVKEQSKKEDQKIKRARVDIKKDTVRGILMRSCSSIALLFTPNVSRVLFSRPGARLVAPQAATTVAVSIATGASFCM